MDYVYVCLREWCEFRFAKLFVLYKRCPLVLLENKTTAKSEAHWTANILREKKIYRNTQKVKSNETMQNKAHFFQQTRKRHRQANDGRNEVT